MKTTSLILISLLTINGYINRSTHQEKEDQGGAIQLKVAAYNVEFSMIGIAQEIGEALKPYNFDVVAFSEAPIGDWTKDAAKAMGMDYFVVGQYSTAGHKDKYKSIASRTPLYDYEEILMTDTLHTVTKAKTRIGDKEIVLYSLHFPSGRQRVKIPSFVDYKKKRVCNEISVLAGDFNFIPLNPEHGGEYYEMFVDIGLDVSWKDFGFDITQHNTHNAFRPSEDQKGKVIDHIMYNPEKVIAIDGGIIEMEKPLSDHKPVWALLKLKL